MFDEAVQEYNGTQKKTDRKIENYYEKIEQGKDKKNNPKLSYELIVAVGNMEECLEDEDTNKKILKEYFEQWKQRNPNLILYNVAYHNDETGVMHLHIDYIPIAHYNKGLSVRNSLNKALNEMGFENDTFSNTPIMRWQKNEQAVLMDICAGYGVETEIKHIAKREHLEKEEYISLKKKENIEKDIHNLKLYNLELEEQKEKLQERINFNSDMLGKQFDTIEQQEAEIKQNEKRNKETENRYLEIQESANDLADEIENALNEFTPKLKQHLENFSTASLLYNDDYEKIINSFEKPIQDIKELKEIKEKVKQNDFEFEL